MIKIEKLNKFYDHFQALKNINLNIAQGEIVGLLGPNGAGKTTLMKILSGSLVADEGHCYINGTEIHQDVSTVQKQLGYLPENPPLYLEMRVRDFLAFVGRIKNVHKKNLKNRIDWAMDSVFITEREQQIIGTLSKGYKQRVGIAMALMGNPKILILDEPTVGLDPNQILSIRSLIKKLGKQRTIILSSHILPEISSTCQKIVIISEGKIIAEDSKEGLSHLASGATRLKLVLSGATANNTKKFRKKLLEIYSEAKLNIEIENDNLEKNNFDNRQKKYPLKTLFISSPHLSSIREQIAKIAVELGFGIYEYRSNDLSLEDVFRKLTLKDGNAAEDQ